MKENSRKCFKCGSTPGDNKAVALYRFPKPGIKNPLRAEMWAKFCIPDGQWSSQEFQNKLHAEHIMLCHQHFEDSSFSDKDKKKLHRHAVPCETFDNAVTISHPPSSVEAVAGPSHLMDVTNTSSTSLIASKSSTQLEQHIIVDKAPAVSLMSIEPVPGPSHQTNVQVQCEQNKMFGMSTVPSSRKTSDGLSHLIKHQNQQLYAKCRKYMKSICQLRNKVKKMKAQHILNVLKENDSVELLSKKLTPTFALLLQAQLRNCKKKSVGRRWTQEEKIVALRLFKRSPTCYRLLRRLFCLPAQSTLKSLLSQFKLPAGVNMKIMGTLKKFVKTQLNSDNEFMLMFDEMSIRKHLEYNRKEDIIEGFQDHGANHGRSEQEATYALVFMIAGLRKKVKQPIGYYLSSAYITADRLAVLIKEVLSHCFEAGIHISACVCDMDGVNRRALAILGASEQKPYFKINQNEVVALYDPPHLLKSFRNLFMKYNIKCVIDLRSNNRSGQGLAKWSHIQDFYQKDNINPNFVFAPSLKKEHLNPNQKQKMKVKYAAQILSHSVAAGMYAKISQGELPAEAITTANIVSKMDKLFDCLNSDSPDLRRGKPHSTNLTNVSPLLEYFREMKTFFENFEFVGCRQTPPSLQGWIWTLNGVRILWDNLKKKHPEIKSLATRRIQQDPLENLFGCIRANCGSNTNPTVQQFVAGIKTAIMTNLAHMSSGNCETDNNMSIINNLKLILTPSMGDKHLQKSTDTLQSSTLTCQVMDESIEVTEDSGESQACAYVCGFLIKKKANDCKTCQKIITADHTQSLLHIFIQYKEFNEAKDNLNYASRQFVNCVETCASMINAMLSADSHKSNLCQQITHNVKEIVNFDFLRACEVHCNENKDFIVTNTFLICVKRFCILKNRQFGEDASNKALKKKIDILQHK